MCMKNMCGGKCAWMCLCFPGNKNLGLLLLRLAAGGMFLMAGIMKLQGMDMTVGFFASVGLGAFWAWVVTIAEVVGGAMVLLGVFTRKAALVLAMIMVFAVILVTSKAGWMASQAPVLLFVISMALALIGGGNYSVTGMCRCGGKCAACKDEKADCGSCCAGGTCSMHEGKDMKCDGCDSCKDKCTMHETK